MKSLAGQNWRGRWVLTMLAVALLVGLIVLGVNAASAQDTSQFPLLAGSLKVATPSSVAPGGAVHYDIVLRNTSAVSASNNVQVSDSMNAGLTILPASVRFLPSNAGVSWTPDSPSAAITFTVPSVAVGKVITLSFDAQVPAGATPGTVIQNVATVTDQYGTFQTNVATFTVSALPAVQIRVPDNSMVINQAPTTTLTISGLAWNDFAHPPVPGAPTMNAITYSPGQTIYRVSWSAVTGVSSYVWQQATNPEFRNASAPQATSNTFTDITAGAAGTYYYRVQAFDGTNTSRWSNVRSVTISAKGQVLAVSEIAADAEALAPAAADVVVEVSTDGGATWNAATVTATATSGVWDWSYGWLLPQRENAAITLVARARYAAGGQYGQTDSIEVTLNNSKTTLTVGKSAPQAVSLLQTYNYVITVNNTGNTIARNLVITDALPDSTSFVAAGQGGVYSLGMVTWQIASLEPQASVQVSFSAKGTQIRTVTNSRYGVRADNSPVVMGAVVSTQVRQPMVFVPIGIRRYPPYPYVPTLLTIVNDDKDRNYTVNWVYNAPVGGAQPGWYTLQEATEATFATPTVYDAIPYTTFKRDFTEKADATYYYRLRSANSFGLSDWSNVVSVTIKARPAYDYGFSTSTLGWAIKRSDAEDSGDLAQMHVESRSANLYMFMEGRADFIIVSPMAVAPSVPYNIKAYMDIVDKETIHDIEYRAKSEMTYGITFGGNGGSPCPAHRTSSGCLTHYYRVLVAYDEAQGKLKWQLKRIDYHEGSSGGGAGRGVTLLDWEYLSDVNTLGWNEWRIEVANATSNNIRVYVNNKFVGQVSDTKYVNDPYFGLFLASPDAAGAVAVKCDWFKVEPK